MNAKDIGYTIAQIFLLACLLAFGMILVAAFDPLDAHGQELRVGVVPTVVTHHYADRDFQDDHDGFGLLAEYQPEDSRFSVGGMFMRIPDSFGRDMGVYGVTGNVDLMRWLYFAVGLGLAAGYVEREDYSGPGAAPYLFARLFDGSLFLEVRGGYVPKFTGRGAAFVWFAPVIGAMF